jgi:hypothetical protein
MIAWNVLAVINIRKFEVYASGIETLRISEPVTSYIVFLLRLWDLTVIFFLLLLVRNGWTLQSAGTLVAFWLALWIVHAPSCWKRTEYSVCSIASARIFFDALLALVAASLGFKWVDDRIKSRSSSPGEATPLNVNV